MDHMICNYLFSSYLKSILCMCITTVGKVLSVRHSPFSHLQLAVADEGWDGVQHFRQVRLVASPFTKDIVHDKVAVALQ